jgi:hypothetical protein
MILEEFDNLDSYTRELADEFGDTDLDDFINNVNDRN